MNNGSAQWLFSKRLDIVFLFVPVWLVWFWAFNSELEGQYLPLWAWVVFILLIDVAHVWSTLFRSYCSKQDLKSHKGKLIWLPIVLLPVLFLLACFSIQLFWGCLAYFAIFHFMKQQYGFMKLYDLKLGLSKLKKVFKLVPDKLVIYVGMIYPILYWHLDTNRSFNWFVEGDFLYFNSPSLTTFFTSKLIVVSYLFLLVWWNIQEVWLSRKVEKSLPWGKMLWVSTTYLNWFVGIVYFNSDYVFSVTNVVAHGVPYLLLVLFYKKKELDIKASKNRRYKLLWFIIPTVFICAFVEEYFWDMLINLEKQDFFQSILPYFTELGDNYLLIAFFTALLSLPQVLHYVFDSFIWKFGKTNPLLKKALSNE